MSNFRAFATVTAALQALLQGTVGADVPGAQVSTDRPDSTQDGASGPAVNIYLYQVLPNAALRNADLPTRLPARDGDGTVLVRRPQAAFDLQYLFTFYGDEGELEPQRLLGSLVRTLHARPAITRELIQAVIDAAGASPPTHPELRDTDLHEQPELVKLAPFPLNLEELSKLWSVFFQVPYALTVAYQASVVLVSSEEVVPSPAPPVLRPASPQVVPLRPPRVDRVVDADDERDPILSTSTLALHGSQLAGPATRVRVAGSDTDPVSLTETLATVPLAAVPAEALRPGPVAVQVVRPLPTGGAITSNTVSMLLHPTISEVAASGTAAAGEITVTTDLTVAARQRVALVLLDPASGQPRHTRNAPERATDAATLVVPVRDVTPGVHLVQIHVDGAGSPLERDPDGNPTGPEVTLP